MKLLIIRGVPGTGKTTVAKILGEILPNSKIINVDSFKLKEMNKGKTFEEAKNIAYDESLKILNLLQKEEYIILEEILCEKEFLNKLQEVCYEKKIKVYYFRLLRRIDKLLITEAQRKRKIKNTQKDLLKIKKDLDKLVIKGEQRIKNNNLALTIKKILDVLF